MPALPKSGAGLRIIEGVAVVEGGAHAVGGGRQGARRLVVPLQDLEG